MLFLDIDGVLSGLAHYTRMRKTGKPRTAYQGWAQMIEERAVARLNQIVRATGAVVVISSSCASRILCPACGACCARRAS